MTFEVEAPSFATTLVYDQNANEIFFVDNTTEMTNGSMTLPDFTGMALFSPDSSTVYVPVRNQAITGARNGAVEAITVSSSTVTAAVSATYAVPSARYIALSPSGQYLLVFADDSDSVFLIDLKATTVSRGGDSRFRPAGQCVFQWRQQYRLRDQLRS